MLHRIYLYPVLGREKCMLGAASKGSRMIFRECDFCASSRESKKPKDAFVAHGADVNAMMEF